MHPFRAAVEAKDFDAAIGLLAPDVVFRSPVVYKPYVGRDTVAVLLQAVSRVFKDMHYTHEIGAPDAADHALVFRAKVGDREVEGCDFLHTGEDGLITEMFVMLRPMSGVQAMAQAMQAELEAAQAG